MRAIFSTSHFARNIDVTVGWIPPTLFYLNSVSVRSEEIQRRGLGRQKAFDPTQIWSHS